MEKCNLCPNACKVNRAKSNGYCGVGEKIKIAKYYLHGFEEPIISGTQGSGTVFFCGCSLKCVFCQNYEVSRNLRGKEISENQLADIFRYLEENGAHNINLVNPTHYSMQIVNALKLYTPKIPIVYNTHGYESVEVLEQIDPFISVYMPDLKYFSPTVSKRYSGKENYFEVAIKAINFMAKKPIKFEGGLMQSGTLVRHLILPQNANDSGEVLNALEPLKEKIYFSLMSQYTPREGISSAFPNLLRTVTPHEYASFVAYAQELGVTNAFTQEGSAASESFIPSFSARKTEKSCSTFFIPLQCMGKCRR